MKEPLNPNNVMLVIKDKTGKEVGRIAATAPNARDYIETLGRTHDGLTIDYVEDEDASFLSVLMSPPRFTSRY
jgi:hypothetical protein